MDGADKRSLGRDTLAGPREKNRHPDFRRQLQLCNGWERGPVRRKRQNHFRNWKWAVPAGWRAWKSLGHLGENDWDQLLERDETGCSQADWDEVVDGEYQKYTVMPGSYIREKLFRKYPECSSSSKATRTKKTRSSSGPPGGHDPEKSSPSYKGGCRNTKGQRTVISGKTD